MSDWRAFVEAGAGAFGRAIEPWLIGAGALALVAIAVAAAVRWRARP